MAIQNGKTIAAELRRYEALQLKVAGASERVIAEQLGVSRGQAYKDVKRVLGDLAKLNEDNANRERALQMERYNRLLLGWWPQALAGDSDAARIVLTLLGRLDSINGLVPDKPQVTLVDNRTQVLINSGEDPRQVLESRILSIASRINGDEDSSLALNDGGGGN